MVTSNKTPQDVREAKHRLIHAGRDMATLLEDERFKVLLESINTKISIAKSEALSSKSYDELLEKRGVIQGLLALQTEIDSITSRGRAAEKTLTT